MDFFETSSAWWTVAHSEDVYDKPVATQLGPHELVVFRDGAGKVRVLQDVCPHRRVPLSLGRVHEHGTLQCGYHGWCFDGSSGRLTKIPNYRSGQRLPPRVRVQAWPTLERYGLVQVWAGAGEAAGSVQVQAALACARVIASTDLAASHEQCVSGLLGDPLALIFGTPAQSCELEKLETTERSVRVTRRVGRGRGPLSGVLFGPKGAEFVLESHTWSTSGLTEISVAALDEVTVLQLIAAPTPIGADRTQLRWRAICRGDMLVGARNRALRAVVAVVAAGTSRRCPRLAAMDRPAFGAWRALAPGPAHDSPAMPELAATSDHE